MSFSTAVAERLYRCTLCSVCLLARTNKLKAELALVEGVICGLVEVVGAYRCLLVGADLKLFGPRTTSSEGCRYRLLNRPL